MIRSENIRIFFTGLGIFIIQVVLMRHLQIFGGESDLILLFLLWLCLKKSRTECLIYAASLGFLQDATTDLWGLHMFSKTVIVFMLHGYLNRIARNKFILWQVFLIILIAAFSHNLIFYGVSLFSDMFATGYVIWSLLIASTVFTAIVGSFLYIVRDDIL